MRLLARTAAILALVGAATMLASQLLEGPASYVIVSGRSMEPSLSNGDLAVVIKHGSYGVGDVVAYHVPEGEPGAGAVVIHRVIGGSAGAGYVTQGDNREGRDTWRPKPDDVIGTIAFQIPGAGLVPMSLGTPLGLGLGAGLLAFFLLSSGGRTRPTGHAPEPDVPPAPTIPVALPAFATGIAPAAHSGSSRLFMATAGVAAGGLVLLTVRSARSRRTDR